MSTSSGTARPTLDQIFEDEGRSFAWLGRRLDVSRQSAMRYVRGEVDVPQHRRAQIALALGRRVDEIDWLDTAEIAA